MTMTTASREFPAAASHLPSGLTRRRFPMLLAASRVRITSELPLVREQCCKSPRNQRNQGVFTGVAPNCDWAASSPSDLLPRNSANGLSSKPDYRSSASSRHLRPL